MKLYENDKVAQAQQIKYIHQKTYMHSVEAKAKKKSRLYLCHSSAEKIIQNILYSDCHLLKICFLFNLVQVC